jgi:hypothetical protein
MLTFGKFRRFSRKNNIDVILIYCILLYIFYRKARRTEILGDGHPDIAASFFNLAALYYKTQRYSKAMQSIQLAVQIYKQILGTDHPTTKAALSWLQAIQNAI